MYQTNSPLSPRETLPTMYDLPSEDHEESGLPDEFHALQPELLRHTFCPPNYSPNKIFTGSDLNLYFDSRHLQWYKRPDWFGVLGVSRLYEESDLRFSYVIWQESVDPFVVVELLSPRTEQEDLGKNLRGINKPPTKSEVYERILRIPYYLVFNRYTNELQAFGLVTNSYQPLTIEGRGVWLEEAQLGLGLRQGSYAGIDRLWLRWYDREQNWILTQTEKEETRAEQEKIRADSAEMELAKLRQLLVAREISTNEDESG